MAKAEPLSPAALSVPQITPQAATRARNSVKPAHARIEFPPKVEQMPLQVRLPRDEVRAIKIAAAENEQTISDFMLSCFHEYMKSGKHV